MLNSYDQKLLEIEFYKIHPEYLPFIGDRYEEYKILHIGESHYINQEQSKQDRYPITYFDKWWNDPCTELLNDNNGWYDTRSVINRYIKNEHFKGQGIFSETLKIFDKVYLEMDNVKISLEERKNYNYFAFMNFFQMPSLYNGVKYGTSLEISAEKLKNNQLANNMYENASKFSSKVLDSVIEVLKPNAIIITSSSAAYAYKKYGKYNSEKFIVETVHPSCSWWNRPIKSCEGRTGKEELEKGLRMLKKKSEQ